MSVTTERIYIACPYTSQKMEVSYKRVQMACAWEAHLLLQDPQPVVINPLLSHFTCLYAKTILPTTFEFWTKQNHARIEWATTIHVLCLDGWTESQGIEDELEFAKRIIRPVIYIPEKRVLDIFAPVSERAGKC